MDVKKINILLDMDGVLSDFVSSALIALNKEFNKELTLDDYAEFGQWGMWIPYNTTPTEFWRVINSTPDLFLNLKPIPWYKELYDYLSTFGEVTILTAPSLTDPTCIEQKLKWLKKYLNLDSNSVMAGNRKHLLAGNGILVDDYSKNVEDFIAAGGEAILIPSTWNTPGLTFEQVKAVLDNVLTHIETIE